MMVNRRDKYQYLRSIQKEVLDLMPKEASSILDVGGGNGDYAAAAKTTTGATRAAVIDISAEAINGKNSKIDIAEVCDIEQPESIEAFINSSGLQFDLVLCLDVLEHLVDPWRVVNRLHAIMPERGYLLASIPNVQNYRIACRSVAGTWHYKRSGLFDRTHLRYFGRQSAIAMLTGSGLTLVAVGRAFGPSAMDRWLHRLSLGLLAPWVTMQNVILVRKTTPEVRDPGFCGDRIPYG